jgi:BirA family biotin operon repressor/biotin-[acetyl-CoA-carboxylase] ligase
MRLVFFKQPEYTIVVRKEEGDYMIGSKVCFFQTIESTNTFMKDHFDEYKHGHIVVSKIQTSGRGRRNRQWVSKDGNLHASIKLTQELEPLTPFEVVMRMSLAVEKALAHFDVDADIKYPNDIIVGNSKIAGILIEQIDDAYIAGVGINVTFSDVDVYSFHPSSILLETSRFVDYRDVLSALIDAYNDLLKEPFISLYEQYKVLNVVLHKSIVWNEQEHRVIDITKEGELVLDDQTVISPNEVSLASWYNE